MKFNRKYTEDIKTVWGISLMCRTNVPTLVVGTTFVTGCQ